MCRLRWAVVVIFLVAVRTILTLAALRGKLRLGHRSRDLLLVRAPTYYW